MILGLGLWVLRWEFYREMCNFYMHCAATKPLYENKNIYKKIYSKNLIVKITLLYTFVHKNGTYNMNVPV